MRSGRRRASAGALAALLALGGALVTIAAQSSSSPDGRLAFSGSWSAGGRRQTLPTEGDRAAIVHLSGAVVVTAPGSTTLGFRGEVIGFDDGRGVSAGRAVWTDARGDRVFSELRGGPLLTGRRIIGTITGGTGRYAAVTGDYALTWQYVVDGEDDAVQGRTVDLRGTFRLAESGR